MKIEMNNGTVVRNYENWVILGNTRNSKWIRIEKKTYMEFEDVRLQINKPSDRISRLIDVLIKTEIIVEKKENINLESLTIAITNKCNLFCKHCGYSADSNSKEQLKFDEIISIINDIENLNSIHLTGGEPMLHPDFYRILNYVHENKNIKIYLLTNGTLINSDNFDSIIEKVHSIDISLDSASNETCSIMRGVNVFDRVIQLVISLKARDFNNISLSFTVTPDNQHELNDFSQLCKDLDVKPVIRTLLPIGRGAQYSLRDLQEDRKELLRLPEPKILRKSLPIQHKCNAGKDQMYVHFDGKVYPCPVAAIDSKFVMGDIRNGHNLKSIRDEILCNKGYKNFSDFENQSDCFECPIRDFCWGCIQEYYTLKSEGDFFVNHCKNMKKVLIPVVWGE